MTSKKMCKIINGRFSWILEVEDQMIVFQGYSSAEYFLHHYKKLGYDVEIDNSTGFERKRAMVCSK